MQRAYDFLARREHSRKELQQKLARRCKDETLIEELLEMLSNDGLQSASNSSTNEAPAIGTAPSAARTSGLTWSEVVLGGGE